MKIAIAGPGRSGTSLLVKLLGAWGLSIPEEDNSWHESANAGLESRIQGSSEFEVDKDPWAYQYLDQLSDEQISKYSVLIVPIRDLDRAASSRLIQERSSRPDSPEYKFWKWDDWGTVPGGAVHPTNLSEQKKTLAKGLWKLLEVASLRGLNVIIINYPRFSQDFEYLWRNLSPYLEGRISKTLANEMFDVVVDPKKIRVENPSNQLSLGEVTGLLEAKIKENRLLSSALQTLRVDISEQIKENRLLSSELLSVRGDLSDKIEFQRSSFTTELSNQRLSFNEQIVSLKNSFERELKDHKETVSWKLTSPLRKIRRLFAPNPHWVQKSSSD